MAQEKIFESEYFKVWYHSDGKIVHHEVLKYPQPGGLRDALNAGAEAMEKYGAKKWLSDDHGVAALPAEDLAWGAAHWEPRVLAAGWAFWAIVKPEKVIGQLTLTRLAEDYKQKGVKVEFFPKAHDALTWLKSQ